MPESVTDIILCFLLVVESGRVDSGGSRRSANRSAGRTKPIVPDNDDSFNFGGAKEVGGLFWNIMISCLCVNVHVESENVRRGWGYLEIL